MLKLLSLISLLFIFSCTTISRLTGNWDYLRFSCINRNNPIACNEYAQYLKNKGDDKGARKEFLVRSCELKNGRGCDLLERLFLQYDTGTLKAECLTGNHITCYQAAMTLVNRGESKEGFNLLTTLCQMSPNSSACQMSGKLKAQMKEEEEIEKEKSKILKMVSSCSNGLSKVCLSLGSMFYQAGYLEKAIEFTNLACVQGNDIGCKLQSNYILHKNGSDMLREQKIANKNQLNHQKQMQSLESSRQFREALRGIGESYRQPAQINCRSITKYNSFTNSYEAESNCR